MQNKATSLNKYSNRPPSQFSQLKKKTKSAKIIQNQPVVLAPRCFSKRRGTWQLTPERLRQLQLMLLQRLRQVPGGGSLPKKPWFNCGRYSYGKTMVML
jgi:hypothetical protein